jgi:putative hydrolase of the HAD superfamily
MSANRPTYTLVFDGDDTLWENNVYFEAAIEDFIDFLQHSRLDRRQVRDVLDEIERLNSSVHGYGSASFGINLRQCYERLCEREIKEEDVRHVVGLAERIIEQPLTLLADVKETIELLAKRHRLFLLTKGHPEEQRLKIERSELAPYFQAAVVVKEKDVETYAKLVSKHKLEPRRTWMIGNSPRSDINPALKAGLNAVYIPHQHTWSLEREEVPSSNGRLIVLGRFAELADRF